MARLVHLAEDEAFHARLAKTEQSFIMMRTPDVEIVRELAVQFDRRQWEVLFELHRTLEAEDES